MNPKGGVITETKLDCHGSRELDLKFTLQHKLIIKLWSRPAYLVLAIVLCNFFIWVTLLSRKSSKAATKGILQEKISSKIWQNSRENICTRVSFLIKFQTSACNFIKKEALTQVFSSEFCEISKNNFFTDNLWVTASELYTKLYHDF